MADQHDAPVLHDVGDDVVEALGKEIGGVDRRNQRARPADRDSYVSDRDGSRGAGLRGFRCRLDRVFQGGEKAAIPWRFRFGLLVSRACEAFALPLDQFGTQVVEIDHGIDIDAPARAAMFDAIHVRPVRKRHAPPFVRETCRALINAGVRVVLCLEFWRVHFSSLTVEGEA